MKTNELRIGNYFLFDGEVDRWQFGHWKDMEFEDEYIGEPIPLTEEWLIKFGFEKIVFDSEETGFGTEYHLIVKNNSGFIIEYCDDFSCGILGSKNDIGVTPNLENCRYVHQLQNLYFALTGAELKTK